MISYKPLRLYLEKIGSSPNRLYTEGIISTNIATSINQNRHMSMENLEKLCLHLEIPIEQVIEIIPDESDSETQV